MAHINLTSARTSLTDPTKAAEDLVNKLTGDTPKLALVFASSDYDQRALNAALRERLPKDTQIVGASTQQAIDNGGYHPGEIVLGAMSGAFDVSVGLGTDLSADAATAGTRAVASAAERLGVRPSDLDPQHHVGLVIDDGYKLKKEEMLIGMLDVSPSLTLIGGGASHALMPGEPGAAPEIHAGADVRGDAVAVALFKMNAPWAALRHHAYTPTGEKVVITKVDPSASCAVEIDGKRAVDRWAELAGVPAAELEAHNALLTLSTALKVGREYFMRSPWKALPDGSILFANMLTENTELHVMKAGDMPDLLGRFFSEEIPAKLSSPRGVLLFECGARGMVAHALGVAEGLGPAFAKAPPAVGMRVAFEICNGFQINSTMTALAFGDND